MELLTTRINLDAIAHNTRVLKEMIGPAVSLRAIVKANAYGHGSVEVSKVAAANGADAFGVATISEAIDLIGSGIESPVLAWIWDPTTESAQRALDNGVQLGVSSLVQARVVAEAIKTKPAQVYIMVETGMHRTGITEEEYPQALQLLAQPDIEILGLMSHFACADEPENPTSARQVARFQKYLDTGRALGHGLRENHISNTAGVFAHPEFNYEMVRTGVALYGLEPIPGQDHGLRPAMTLSSIITDISPIHKGDGVSYNHTWIAPTDGYLAVIPAGYADGIRRSWQNHLEITINGERYPQVGRVCMDQICVFLGANSRHIKVGDTALLFGEDAMSATELAQRTGTINYEIVCAPTGRARRVFEYRRRTETAEDTQELGKEIGQQLQAGDVVILDGPLGAGKTTFTQGLAAGMGVRGRVTSPTFVIAREHEAAKSGDPSLIHVDAYRLLGEDAQNVDPLAALDSLDLDSELEDAVVVAEWGGGLIEQLAGNRTLVIKFDRETAIAADPDSEARYITWQWHGENN
ncbi:Alanine racemase [Corynebacterium caspium DSM 44850]|nr:alanine racemase [Corynebacterium caspium]WKD59798.1 Alanine racemase [Corynebacterium caspium DSM 44850]